MEAMGKSEGEEGKDGGKGKCPMDWNFVWMGGGQLVRRKFIHSVLAISRKAHGGRFLKKAWGGGSERMGTSDS